MRWIWKKTKPLTPVEKLSPQDIRHMRIVAETQAVVGSNIATQEFVPPDYPVTTLADVITDPQRKIGYIPLALRVIYCILWQLDSRVKVLENQAKTGEKKEG
jgi:hypothetical protein